MTLGLSANLPQGIVNQEDAEAARAYLQQRLGSDLPRFLGDRTMAQALNQVLGPAPECLSITAISSYVESEREATTGEDELRRLREHLQGCPACRENVALFRSISRE